MEATTVSCCSTNWQIGNGECANLTSSGQIRDQLRTIVRDHARLNLPFEDIEDSTDLYRAGMSSQGSVVLMIAVEGEFGVEFPDSMLSRDVFSNINAIATAVEAVMRAER